MNEQSGIETEILPAVERPEQIEGGAWNYPAIAETLRVVDDASMKRAGAFVVEMKRREKVWGEFIDPVVEAANKTHKLACSRRKKIADPINQAIKIVEPRMVCYVEQKRRDQEEAERKAREEAALQEAIAAEEAGDSEKAEAALNGQGNAPVVLPDQTPKVEGVTVAKRWKAEIVDIKALARAVADGIVPPTYIIANMTTLDQVARAQNEFFNVPGVRAVQVGGIRVSTT